MSVPAKLDKLLDEYRDYAWESGWYSAVLERAYLTDEEKAEYERLHGTALQERDATRAKIERMLSWPTT